MVIPKSHSTVLSLPKAIGEKTLVPLRPLTHEIDPDWVVGRALHFVFFLLPSGRLLYSDLCTPVTMSQSGSTRRTSAQSGARPRGADEPSGLPLVRCTGCRTADIIELMAWTDENYGKKFFKCPRYASQNGCNCFMWLPTYVSHLKELGLIVDGDVARHEVEVKEVPVASGIWTGEWRQR